MPSDPLMCVEMPSALSPGQKRPGKKPRGVRTAIYIAKQNRETKGHGPRENNSQTLTRRRRPHGVTGVVT